MSPLSGTRLRLSAAVPATAALLSLCLAANAAWIPLKAALAQRLIDRSWEKALAGGTPGPPWPWADTTPAAVLTAPGQGIRLLVLEGNSGRNLAFGPVLANGLSRSRDIVISGHRDTHFRFLQDLRRGDRLRLETPDGGREFEVRELDVVDSRTRELAIEPTTERLSLVTCYPFEGLAAGGPLRYVVTAYPLTPGPR